MSPSQKVAGKLSYRSKLQVRIFLLGGGGDSNHETFLGGVQIFSGTPQYGCHMHLKIFLFIVCDVSNAEQPKNSFSLFQRRTQKRTILYSLHSMTKTSYAARIPLTVQLLNGKYPVSQIYNCFISSFKLFHLVRTSVYCCSVTWPERYTEVHTVS